MEYHNPSGNGLNRRMKMQDEIRNKKLLLEGLIVSSMKTPKILYICIGRGMKLSGVSAASERYSVARIFE